MLIVGIIFSVLLLAAIVYFAVSPKSSRILRLSAIIALGLICLSIVICGIFIIKGPSEEPGVIPLPVFQDSSPQAKRTFPISDVIILTVLLVGLSLVIVKSLRDSKKKPGKPEKSKEPLDFPDDELGSNSFAPDDGEDSFDLDDLDIK